MTWLDKLCGPLLNPKYPQVRGTLVKRSLDDANTIIGKCAEGEIACQNKIQTEGQMVLTSDQLRSLNIPYDLASSDDLPLLRGDIYNVFFDIEYTGSIGSYIVTLNDNGFTYPQIVEFLQTTFEDAV